MLTIAGGMRRLIVLLAVCLVGLPSLVFSDENEIGKYTVSSGNGRYALGQISRASMDRYLLDTKEGRAWKLIEDNGYPKFVPVIFPVGDTHFSFSPDGQKIFIPPPKKKVEPTEKGE